MFLMRSQQTTSLNEVTDDGDIVEVNECPTDLLTIIFYNANRLDCAQFLAEALAKELFSYGEVPQLALEQKVMLNTIMILSCV